MNTRKKREKRRKLVEAIEQQARLNKEPAESIPAKASKYLHRLKDYYKKHPDMQVMGYGRVSRRPQKDKCNLDTYNIILRRKCKKRGIPFVGYFGEQNSGRIFDYEKREELIKAVKKAERLIKRGKDIAILAPSTDRFLRNRKYTPQNRLLPIEEDFKKLMELTHNVPLLTLLHPDMPLDEVTSYHTKWGQRVKGNKGGRPKINKPGYKKKRRLEKLPIVRQLSREGKTLAQIAAQMPDVPKVTIWYWLKHFINAI